MWILKMDQQFLLNFLKHVVVYWVRLHMHDCAQVLPLLDAISTLPYRRTASYDHTPIVRASVLIPTLGNHLPSLKSISLIRQQGPSPWAGTQKNSTQSMQLCRPHSMCQLTGQLVSSNSHHPSNGESFDLYNHLIHHQWSWLLCRW